MQEEKNNVIKLDNDFTREENQIRKMKKQELYKRRRIGLIFIIAMVGFTLPSIKLYEAFNELVVVQHEKKVAEDKLESISATQKQLKKQVKLLEDDKYVAKVARNKYYLSKDGETVYTVPDIVTDENNSDNQKSDTEVPGK
jgi:cell division protein DivIC